MPVQSIRPQRLYELIAQQIAGLIRSAEFKPGSRLPSEHELARQLGVSRPSVREAMIALETTGLVEVRNGNGAYVRGLVPGGDLRMPWAGDADPGPGPLEQFRARELVECELVETTAGVITAAEIDALEKIVDRMEAKLAQGALADAEHLEFHVGLAEASRNSILANLVRSLFLARENDMWTTIRVKVQTVESQTIGVAFRRELIAALRRRDGDSAKRAMRRHFERVETLYFGD